MKEANVKRLRTVGLHLTNILEKTKLWWRRADQRTQGCGLGRDCDYTEDTVGSCSISWLRGGSALLYVHENSQKIHSKKRQFYPMITKKNNRIFKIFRYLQNSLLQSTVMRKISGKIVLRDILQNSWPRTLQSVMFKKEKEVSQILRGLRRHDN